MSQRQKLPIKKFYLVDNLPRRWFWCSCSVNVRDY